MLRYAFRRILWALPTLLGISFVVFFLTTLLPDLPVTVATAPDLGVRRVVTEPSRRYEAFDRRRDRFLDLPRFFNSAPSDVRSAAQAAVESLSANDDDADFSAFRLARSGGAALPYVLPSLDKLAPEARGRVALALAPIATRMGLGTPEELAHPDEAVLFWTRFWEDRALEFTGPSVDRAVTRFVEHGSDMREHDLREVDTYAMPQIMTAMQALKDTTADRHALARLSRVAVHVSQRGPEIPEGASDDEARRASADWKEWWYIHEADYAVLDGGARISAMIGQTRYGRWVMRGVTGQLGVAADGESIAQKMRSRAPVTLLITAISMLASYALAIPIAVVAAWRRGRPADTVAAGVLFALYSVPTYVTAELLRRAFHGSPDSLVLPIATLTIGSLATLSRYQRSAMLDVLGQDYVRTARAKGVSTVRVLIVHALRNALLPTVTLAGLQLPALLGGAFIVEETFAIPGLGYETLRAVKTHDAPWLLAIIVLAALVTTAGLITSDLAYGFLDPRVRDALMRRRGAS